MNPLTRRAFLIASMKAGSACVVSVGLAGCLSDDDDDVVVSFLHGVASGDPLSDSVILWTRATPDKNQEITVSWEVATDSEFKTLVHSGSAKTNTSKDYTLKVDVQKLNAGTQYHYRFKSGASTSPSGVTKTLTSATGNLDSLKIALFSCAMWEHGYFHAYADAVKQNPDVVLHVGDYIYEYATGKYGSATGTPVRVFDPVTEIVSLADYRKRYAQYRTDASLQAMHAKCPWITIWDDHEVANDTYKAGAENHSVDTEGTFVARKAAALQAYYEWLPIRVQNPNDLAQAYRSFDFGNLLSLHVLESRLLARDESAAGKQNQLALITDPAQLSKAMTDLTAILADPTRKLLGDTQMGWLQARMSASTATWQILGNETIMARMTLPQSLLLFKLGATDFAAIAAMLATTAQVKAAMPNADAATIKAAVDANLVAAITQGLVQAGLPADQAAALAPSKVTMLANLETEGKIPYNLDAWDGYPYEQATIMGLAAQIHQAKAAKGMASNLVVLTGDSHNAWANNLRFIDPTTGAETPVGVEFAGTSVSSVGLEKELRDMLVGAKVITEAQFDANLFANIFTYYIQDNQFLDMTLRGYTLVNFSKTEVKAEYHLLDSVTGSNYDPAKKSIRTVIATSGANKIASVD
jgi:alkaline phosphatase D